jgi:hypothetical protein
MADFATLLLTADSRGLVSGEQALDRLASTAERTENRTGKALEKVGKAANDVGKQSAYASQGLRMQAMQLSQVAQQASATGNWLQAIAIQLPDLALAFGPLGIAAGAAAGAALSYYSTLIDSGEDAEETLAAQADLIQNVAESWGDAVPALTDYVNQLKEAKRVSDLLDATDKLQEKSWQAARTEVQNLTTDVAALTSDLMAAGAADETISRLQSAFADVSKAVSEGREDAGAMKEAQDALADAFTQTGIPAIGDYQDAFTRLSETIAGALRQANLLEQQAIRALTTGQGPLKPLTSVFSENGKIYTGDDFTPINPPTPENRPKIELEGLYWENRNTGGGSRRVERISKEQREIQSLYDSTRTAAEKYNIELTRLDELHEKFGLDSDTYSRAIKQLADDYYASSDAAKTLAEQTEYYKDSTSDLLHDVRSALSDGKIEWDEWADIALNALDRVLDKLQNSFIDSAFEALGGKSGGGGGALLGKHFNLNLRSAL